MEKVYRQGELLFIPLITGAVSNEDSLKRVEGNIIREGEVTGHKHEVVGNATLSLIPENRWERPQVFKDMPADMFLRASEDVKVIHPEHNTLNLPKGEYGIRIQREYDEVSNRNVMD